MKKTLEHNLCERYGQILRIDLNNPLFGFECGDGWYSILDALFERMAHHASHSASKKIVITQVKEKYGSLRVYYISNDPILEAFVDLAESLSERTCEVCGCPGKMTVNATKWIRVRCQQHEDTSTAVWPS